MKANNKQILDLVVIGSGLSALNFIDSYLEKKKIIHVISPSISKNFANNKRYFNHLPSQMSGKDIPINNYFNLNKIDKKNSCKALGILDSGGLSNYWGLQLDGYINKDQINLKQSTFKTIEKSYVEFLKKFKLLGTFQQDQRVLYQNDYKIPEFLKNLTKKKYAKFICKKPILAFSKKNLKNSNLNNLNEQEDKIISKNFLKSIKRKNKIVFHNYYVQKILNKKNSKEIEIICKNNNEYKKIIAKKVVFCTGTIATTKIIMDYLDINSEVKIKHHPRLLSMFISKKPIKSNLVFTPSLMQIINKSKKDYYAADLRPGNKLITRSIIETIFFMKPFKFLINLLRHRLLFSNILLDSSYSDIFIKRENKVFKLYNKSNNLDKILKQKNKKIFGFLLSNKIILPIYKTFYPGSGADYHYFGSIPFNKKGKLSVNNNCQLNTKKNIYIVDGSTFDFKTNKYPLGFIIANARRMGKLLSK